MLAWAKKVDQPSQRLSEVRAHEGRRPHRVSGKHVDKGSSSMQGRVFMAKAQNLSYRDALTGPVADPSFSKESAGGSKGQAISRVLKFSDVEQSSREWMDQSLVGRWKTSMDVHAIQARLSKIGAEVQIFPIGKVYCYISFPDGAPLSTSLQNRMLDEWFSEVKKWEDFDLADGDLLWICMSGVPILAWNDQFFSFVVAEFGHFLGVSPAMELKLNLREAWVKVRCKGGVSIPHIIDLQLPHNCHQVRLEAFSPKVTPFRSVSGFVASCDISSAGSCCEESPEVSWKQSDKNINGGVLESLGRLTVAVHQQHCSWSRSKGCRVGGFSDKCIEFSRTSDKGW